MKTIGTCPKCKDTYELTGCNMTACICPNCKSKGVTIPGVITFKPEKSTLKEAARALLEHIKEHSVCDLCADDGDGHIDQWCSEKFSNLMNDLRKALEDD